MSGDEDKLPKGLSEGDAGDGGEAGGEGRGGVGADGEGYGAGVVEFLGDNRDFGVLDGLHNVVHGEIREGETDCLLLVALDNLPCLDRETGGFLIGRDQPRGAEFNPAEITHDDNQQIGKVEGIDLAENRFSGSARRFPVVVAEEVEAVGAEHIGPADMAGVEIFL